MNQSQPTPNKFDQLTKEVVTSKTFKGYWKAIGILIASIFVLVACMFCCVFLILGSSYGSLFL